MRILQVSDTHIGITSRKTLEGLFRNAAREDFDVLVHCGDYSGRAEARENARNRDMFTAFTRVPLFEDADLLDDDKQDPGKGDE